MIAELRSSLAAKHPKRPLNLPDALKAKLQIAVAGSAPAAAAGSGAAAAAAPSSAAAPANLLQAAGAHAASDVVVRKSADGSAADGDEGEVQVGVRRKRR